MMPWLVVAAALWSGPAASNWNTRLIEARYAYSIEAVDLLITDLSNDDHLEVDPTVQADLAEAYLIKAELLRFEFEQLPEEANRERRQLGDRLDDAAAAGMAICETLPESSEKYRQRADLRGTLIRTKFRAKKHRKRMEADAIRAIELDPDNARAYVSKAKPFLFADDRHGGDIERALDLLHHALELDDSLETAHLLYAYGLQEAERLDEANRYYRSILEKNPNCRPAQAALKDIGRHH